MLKDILKTKGAQELNKNAQKEIQGGMRIEVAQGPCGTTGGRRVDNVACQVGGFGVIWFNGACYECF